VVVASAPSQPPPNVTIKLSNLGEGQILPLNSMLLAFGGTEGGRVLAKPQIPVALVKNYIQKDECHR